MTKGLEFDPGFAPHILAFQGTVEYLYLDINKFKNLSQKKIKFRQYYKKILEIFYNNLGFYVGCLMWAAYIKTQPVQEILNNSCLNQEYNEEQNTLDTDYLIRFVELFPKDMHYFLGEKFSFEPWVMQILDLYREILVINRGFVESKTNNDIKLPANMKTDLAEGFKEKIDEILKEGDLSKLIDFRDLILG